MTRRVRCGRGGPSGPNGSIGFRYGEAGAGRWDLRLDGLEPALTLSGREGRPVPVDLPRFDVGETEGGSVMRRGVPARILGSHLVTTAFDLLLAQYGVARSGLWRAAVEARDPAGAAEPARDTDP